MGRPATRGLHGPADPGLAPYRIALLGLGVVGRATADVLLGDAVRVASRAGRAIALAAVAVRSPARLTALALPPGTVVTADPQEAAATAGVDAVVELMGGLDPAAQIVRDCLAAGRSVVTANKRLLAARGPELEATSRAAGSRLRFEAAVGGGTPLLRVCASDLAGVRIDGIRGVVNGTTNWVLDAMERDDCEADAAVAAAQAAGYAEADPSLDLDGLDAADKLVLLARLAFGVWIRPDSIVRVGEHGPGAGRPGIRGIDRAAVRAAAERGRRIRLVAEARRTPSGTDASVLPRELPLDDPLASARGVGNVVTFDAPPLGSVTVAGPGAGGPATAAAVVADLIALARGEGSTWASSPLEGPS